MLSHLRLLTLLLGLTFVGTGEALAQQSVARQWNEQLLAAIRRNVPNPPSHARNLFHTAVAMYDAWAAYDATAVGCLYNEKISPLPGNIEAAREEALSYAAYRVLRSRFATGAGSATSLASFDTLLSTLGYSPSIGQAAITNGATPAEAGKRIGQMVLNWGAVDGFSNTNYPQSYTNAVNPNLDFPMPVLGTNGSFVSNMPLGYGIPAGTNPNLWQPLALATSVTQNGIPVPGGNQTFLGVQSLATQAFSLSRTDSTKPWIDPGAPSRLSTTGQPSTTDAQYKENAMDVLRKSAALNDDTSIDISPASYGNNPLGTDNGSGYAANPVAGGTYSASLAKRSDFYRVLAEFWADGPNSETPPGHWHVLANEVADDPLTVKRIKGVGPIVNNLEWDVKTYLAIGGAVHDAACCAWSLKRYYSGTRPITAIRYMCSKGQSSDPFGPSYHPEGIPLETGVTEVITAATAAPGGRHETIWDVNTGATQSGSSFIGQIAVFSWPGEDPLNLPAPSIATHKSSVRWMLGKDWLPFQRKTFNTPAFPGYISGHSTFSRAAAEALVRLTGSQYFPGGFHHHTVTANTLQIDLGPSASVDLQWASYYDAADQAGISRRYGGIHPGEDDYPGRVVGSQAGVSAFNKAEKYWTGSVLSETLVPTVTMLGNGDALVTWTSVPGHIYKVQQSTNYTTWTDASKSLFASTSTGSLTVSSPTPGSTFQVVETTPSVARMWNERLLNAIRLDTPHPPKHARNLFHTAVAMYDAWTAYDTTAIGYIHHERATAGDIASARKQAVSYAAYRILKSRFAASVGAGTTLPALDAQMAALGYDVNVTTTSGTTPAALGNRVAATILAWGLSDGSNQAGGYTDPAYYNPQPPMIVLQSGSAVGGIPAGTDPNRWQPLALDAAFAQNGVPIPDQVQNYVGVTWLSTLPFSLSRAAPGNLWFDPGPLYKLSVPGSPSSSDMVYKQAARELLIKSSQLNSSTLIDISPGAMGNNPLGSESGTGHPLNPVTGQPYASNLVKLGDFARVMAEFWADGPDSETPPGHWHVLANEASDAPGFQKKIGGTGPVVDDLEWDVKLYFAIAGATHDAACACWGAKRYFEGPRPVTMIRYLASQGQSSDPNLASYNSQGILLEPGVCEVITSASSAPGQRHEWIWDINSRTNVSGSSHINEIAVLSWPSEPDDRATQTSPVRWMFGKDWVPYQRKNFNTPAFPGYISGHSTFSRSAAEVLASITGSPYVPGGLGTFTANANSYLVFERGPTQTVNLQWATYYDAADLAGASRRWGGIHPAEDDLPARIVGAETGQSVWKLAQKYWNGTILAEKIVPSQTFLPGGGVTITCPARRGLYYHLESSPDLINWTAITSDTRCPDTMISFTDPSSASGPRFYRVVFDAKSS